MAALVLTPLLVFRPAYEQFVMPKMVWVQLLAAFLAALAVVRATSGDFVRVPIHATGLFLALFVLWHVAASPLAMSTGLAWERAHWLVCVLIVSWQWQEWAWGRPRRVLLLFDLVMAAGALTAAWAIYQDATAKWANVLPAWWPGLRGMMPRLADWRGMIAAGLGNTDHIAAFLAVLYLPGLVRLFALGKSRRTRLGRAALLVALWLMAAAMILCWSVGNNASLILGAALLAGAMGHTRRAHIWRRARGRLLLWVAGCIVAILWLTTDTPANPHRPGIFQEAFGSERWKEGGPTRLVIWLNTLDIIARHPFLGVGPGNFIYAYPAAYSPLIPDDPAWLRYVGAFTNAAHNSLLQTWAELGVAGVVLLVLIVAAGLRGYARALGRARGGQGWMVWGGLSAFLVLCLTSIMTFPLQLPVSTLLFFCLAPLGHCLANPARDERGFLMPAFRSEGAMIETEFITREMRRPVSIGLRLGCGPAPRVVLAIAAMGLATWWGAHSLATLRADVLYHRGRRALVLRNPAAAQEWFEKAWTLKPGHYDARINTVKLLLAQERYAEALEQLHIVWERLNSTELYLLQYRALNGLGRYEEAKAAFRNYLARMPLMARQAGDAAQQTQP